MTHIPLQPLFTTSPLLRPTFSCPFTSPPIPSNSTSIEAGAQAERLTFPKIPLSSTVSTDSETHSDWAIESTSGRSHSLLTCLYQRQTSSDSSTNPRTPVQDSDFSSTKPILRRDTASDDGTSPLLVSQAQLNRKKSCLKFNVVPCSSDSGLSPQSSLTQVRPHRLPPYSGETEYHPRLSVLESESDDEGYEEDEEGGFTSDEDQEASFTTVHREFAHAHTHSNPRPWSKSTAGSDPISSPSGAATAGPSRPFAKRQISIIAPKPSMERCSRHFSPPPTTAQLGIPAAPPPAQSPSAREFCRRKGVGHERPGRERGRVASDDPAFVSILRRPSSTSASSIPSLGPRRGPAPACTVADRVEAGSLIIGSGEGARKGLEQVLRRDLHDL